MKLKMPRPVEGKFFDSWFMMSSEQCFSYIFYRQRIKMFLHKFILKIRDIFHEYQTFRLFQKITVEQE